MFESNLVNLGLVVYLQNLEKPLESEGIGGTLQNAFIVDVVDNNVLRGSQFYKL